MFKIIKDSGFKGLVGVDNQGGSFKIHDNNNRYLDDDAGILAARNIAVKAGQSM
jgi:hypothetical protein